MPKTKSSIGEVKYVKSLNSFVLRILENILISRIKIHKIKRIILINTEVVMEKGNAVRISKRLLIICEADDLLKISTKKIIEKLKKVENITKLRLIEALYSKKLDIKAKMTGEIIKLFFIF